MQNHQGVPSTAGVVGASNTASFVGTNMVQLQSNDGQTKYYTVDMNAYSKMVSTQRPSNSYITIQPQVIPLQNNAGQQYVRIQLPNVQQGSNFVRLQSLPSQTNNMQTTQNISQNLVSVHTNLLNNQVQPNTNQQQVAIQLVQQPIKNKTQSELINVNKSPKGKPTLTPAQIQSSLNGLVPVMVSPHSKGSLVGTVSVGQATPVVHINNYVQQNMAQQPNTHQVAAAFFPASPVKKQQTGPVSTPITSASSSLFQALQAVNNQLTAPVVSRITSNTLPTVLNSLNPQQQLSLQQQQAINNFVAHHATQLPTQQQTLFYGQSNSKNDDLSSKGFPGTIMMLSGNHGTGKQQVLIPKTNPSSNQKQSSMFVPITMASNVSVTTNQASSILTTKRIENTQASSSNALRIQQQIAPRLPASTHPTSSSTGVANISINPSNQKILIPVQSSSNQQQYIIQSVPHHQQSSLLQAQQKQDASSPAQTNTKLTARPSVVAGSITDSKPVRKPCNCTKSQCLKLYCECFANGEFCNNCNCRLCLNNISHENERSKAIKACLERNPYAFHPKIGKGKIKGDNERRHTKGCNCKRSGCLKNYCECYEAKILCSGLCKCVGCKNFEESTDRQTLMHLADAAEVRVLQQNAANSKLVKQSINRTSTNQKEKLPVNFVTADVSKATCDILLACVQEAEALNLSEEDTERSVIEEFSRCLNQIIDKSNEVKRGKR